MRCRGQVDGKDCGRVLSPDVKFCADCGQKNENQRTSNCSACGAGFNPGDKFCPSCGEKVNHGESNVKLKICTGTTEDGSLCGNVLALCINFCPKCGAKVLETATPPHTSESIVQKDVNPNVKDSDRYNTESHGERQSDVASCSPCKKHCGPEAVLAENSNVGSMEQLHDKDQPGTGDKVPPDTRTVSDNTGRDGATLNTAAASSTKHDTNTSVAAPETDTRGATPDTSASSTISDTATSGSTSGTATKDVAPGRDKTSVHVVTANQGGIGHGDSSPPPVDQPSAPVPCTDGDQGAGANSNNSSSTQYSKNEENQGGGGTKATDVGLSVPGNAKDTAADESKTSGVAEGASTGIQTGFFSQFADQPMVEKEIIFLEKWSLNNVSLSGDNSDHTKEAQEKLSGAKNSSEMYQAGERDTHAQASQIETEKNVQDKLNQNNSNAEERSGSGDDGHKEELDEAVRSESKGSKEHVDKVKNTGHNEKGDKEKRNSAEAGKAEAQQATTSKKNDTQSRENHSAGTSQTQSGQPGAGAAQTPGQPPPEQQREKKPSYAEAASKPGPSKRNQGNAGRNAQLNSAEKVTVVFHVIISNLWEKMDPSKYHVVLRCKPASLGSFDESAEDTNKLAFVRKTEIGFLYEGKVMMERHLRNSGFQYKYTAKKVSGKSRRHWELVQRKVAGVDPALVNRYFHIPEKKRSHTGIWHRFDGVAYFPEAFPTGYLDRFMALFGHATFSSRFRSDAIACAKLFLPSAEHIHKASLTPASNGQTTMEGFLEKIDQVMSSLRLQMFKDPIQDFVDDSLVQKAVYDAVVRPLADKLAETKSQSVTLGLFLELLVENFDIPPDVFFIQLMCRSLLINPEMDNSTCADLDNLTSHFPVNMANKRGLAGKVLALMDRSDDRGRLWHHSSDTSWLCCVPLLHFLQDKSQPYQDLELSSDFRKKEWWGLTDFTRRQQSYKDATKLLRLPDSVIDTFKPAFKVDPLFVRTFVACLELEPLLPVLLSGIIPVEVMAATLAHHLQEKNVCYDEHKKKVAMCLKNMVSMSMENAQKKNSLKDLKGVTCSAQIIKTLHEVLLRNKRTVSEDTILNGSFLMFLALDHVASIEERECEQNGGVQAQGWRQDVKEVTEGTCRWLSSGFTFRSSRSQTLQMWDTLLAKVEELSNVELKKTVKQLLAEGFEKELDLLHPEQKLAVYLEQHKMVPAFADILNRLAFESLDAAFKIASKHLDGQNESAHLISLLSDFIEQKWKEQVTPLEEEEDVLKFVVTWIPMVNYFRRFGQKTDSSKTFSQMAAEHVHHAQGCLRRLLDDLREGSVRIQTLQLLMSNHDRFLDLVEANGDDKTSVAAVLQIRNHELQIYISTATHLYGLLEYCRQCLKTEDLHEVVKKAEQLQDTKHTLPLSDVCDIALPDSIRPEDLQTYKPKANPWKLSDDVCAILPEFSNRITSYIFKKLFSETAQRMELSSVEFWRAFQRVWSEVSKEWKSLCCKMVDGTISLAETEKVFRMFRADGGSYRYHEIREELHKLGDDGPGKWVDERIEQFDCFIAIKEHIKAASMLLQVREAYSIEGDFGDIEKICNLSQNKKLPVRDVDRSVLRLCALLKDFSAQGIDCLKGFVQRRCLDFVCWLRKNMTGGVKEVNVFVDLAFISAGEEPWAIGRVNCFHAAVTGYAPLIFLDKSKGCTHLLQECKRVFANVAADGSLPEKLNDSSRYLGWFKDVQKSHGSVEKTSLSQVGNINARGVFRVCRASKQEVNLHSVIQLKVSEDAKIKDKKDATPPRKYTYTDLLDLQSRLMLVAGQAEKGKENVDRFITVMESLVRLGKTYVQLCSDGCVLFLDWSVEFLCDVDRPVCCVSEFASRGKLKGHRTVRGHGVSGTDDLEDFIAGVAGFLECCHTEWLQYVDQKRKDYPELNVYTVEQLVFLQQQLVKVGSADVSKHVFPMLSLLKSDCSPQDLEEALQDAMDLVDSVEQRHRHNPQHQPQQPEPQPADDKEKAEEFVKEMLDSGFSKTLALKAMKEVGVEDTAEGIAWCMNHENDMEELSDEMSSTDEDEEVPMEEGGGRKLVGERLREWVTRTETITQSAIDWLEKMDKREKGTTLKSVVHNLRSVWCQFLQTVSSSGTDFLSLEHLGIVLRCLAAKDEREFKRSLPPTFKPKTPNLILCSRGEVLNAVTYMYMFPEDERSLLPQPDEVLLCTENTTFEQVDIFLRRAFFGTQQKVHCLAFADSLDYDVGEKAEKKIKEYVNSAENKDYKLVVVCTTENEYRARIVAALEKFRRPSPALSTTNMVRNYLRSRFVTNLRKTGVQSAALLDSQNLCVRVVRSNRSGVGKTLYKQRLTTRLKQNLPRERRPVSITIPLHGRVALTHDIAACLLKHTLEPGTILPRIVHLDISYQVQEGVDHLLYNLLVLGCVTDSHGQVWLRSPMDLYLVETMPLLDQKDQQKGRVLVHQIFDVLPSLNCWSPQDSLSIMKNPRDVTGYQKLDCLFDDEEFRSDTYQRPFRYLHQLETQGQQLPANVQGGAAAPGEKVDCLATLLKYCGVFNPSWSELTHFVCFLDKQLQDFENSVYCGMATSQDLPGFSVFVLRFLIQMSRDFATRSLKMSEESLAALVAEDTDATDIQQYEMRRTWESSPHPYIFFNPDGHSLTFLGFSIDAASGNLVDQQTGQVLEQAIMNRQLHQALVLNRVPLMEDFDALPRADRLLRLYRVLGLYDEEIFDNGQIIDPDDTYELTTDNVKKILAIYMRFRCNIPVIVMGETGCGKTRLVKFLCALQTPRRKDINTMVLVKVHGGTTGEDIMNKVREAEKVAQRNAAAIGHRPVYTVLFFDEANTTEAVGVIKEVMCDGTLDGQQITLSQSLKMVAACNPYRKHSEDLIQRLENAGLGYHIDADKTVDKLGRVPMRRLVYRVQPLPQSMLPLVWDFGQLNTRVEELYIRQMVRRYVHNGQLDFLDEAGMNVMCRILMESQEFMRLLADECSFVSLRDVDRALTVTSWFLKQARESHTLFDLLKKKLQPEAEEDEGADAESLGSVGLEDEDEEEDDQWLSDMTKSLVLSLGVCYRACLRSKEAYDQHIVAHFQPPFTLPNSQDLFARIIDSCQDVFLDTVRLDNNIARNQALKENVFMMVVCVELRIPLFLVGKPGSSKSLAKTIVSDAMQGNSAHSELFKTLKQAQMVSFQCSPLATAEGILGTFRQCAEFQKGKNKDTFVSVVVLDEVGLAEDSPKMPLKTLHPLLEDGCPGDEVPDGNKKVAFIGISNWALDPAKMNRGILVQRDVPDEQELIETARGICTTHDQLVLMNVEPLIPDLAKAYLQIFRDAKSIREFFGLRDFYSLVKMVYAFAAQSKQKPSQRQLIAAIRRNFGGLDTVDPVKSFRKFLPTSLCDEKARPKDPDCTAAGLIRAALHGDNMGGESRYLLLLTENYGGLTILSENLLAGRRVVRIFGSSFPKDQEYTQICRNINRIKVCMETGQTVVLLNLENLYESLYDALNQYYAMLGGDRYVDLGLGTHRVKCRVDRQFRLIVVAEKQVVYDKFPIPLINRLEKHFLTLNNIMNKDQLDMAEALEKWAKEFVSTGPAGPITRARARDLQKEVAVGDVFMGYHPDAAPAIILKVWDMLDVAHNPSAKRRVLAESQRLLLWCATPEAVVRSREPEWSRVYHQDQQHEHLQQYLQQLLQQHAEQSTVAMAQVTTHSKLLTEQERLDLCQHLPVCAITLLSLQAFDMEQQFCQQLRLFFSDNQEGHKLLVVQCDCGDLNQNLIKCAQYCMQDLRPEDSTQHHVVFIVQLPRVAGACFTGFLGGNWHCLHIDDLRATDHPVPPLSVLQTQTPANLLMASVQTSLKLPDVNTNKASPPDSMQWEEGEQLLAADGGDAHGQEMEVDVEDVQVELEQGVGPSTDAAESGWQVPQLQGFDPQYVKHLFTSSIQAAVALVRDVEDSTTRATCRITILLHLMEENAEFFSGLHKLVGSILMEKEQYAHEADRWLSKEAARLDLVKKAGTFRRSWMQYLENKVVPVLAGAIAYLDTNNNLDLLYSPETDAHHSSTPQWARQVWLEVLQSVCQLNYKHLRSVSDKDELEEFTVHHTGAGALPFSARLPFSWLLWELVDSAILGAKDTEGDLLDMAGGVVEQSPLGRCVQRVLADSEDNLQDLFHLYISDLLYFTFPLGPPEHQLLCGCMEKGLRQLRISLVSLEVGRGLVMLHMLVEQMRPRLQAILDMANVRPGAAQALRAGATGPCSELLNTPDEMTEDIAVLRLLLEELQPRPSQLDNEDSCLEWAAQYSTIAPVVLRILSDSELVEGEEGEEVMAVVATLPYGDKCRQQLVAIRCLWTRVTTLKLFLDFMGPLRRGPEKLRKALNGVKFKLLNKLLQDEDVNMKQEKSLQQVDKFLKHANGFMIKGLLGKVGQCSYCELKLESAPVELPCKHQLCNSCYMDACYGDQADAMCPQCQAPVPRGFDPSSTQSHNREAAELLGRYQRQVSGFLMAVVSQLCFAGREPPEHDAIKHIFSYITRRSKGRTLLQTKHMTVHDDLIDPTPVLRSFLLRLLFKHSESEVCQYLEEFLRDAQLVVDQEMAAMAAEQPGTPTQLEFSLLIIHCIEDLHHEQDALTCADLSREERLLSLADMLCNQIHSLSAARGDFSTLYSLGRLRYALDACAHILHNTFVTPGGSPVISEELEDLLSELQFACQNDATDWPRKFVIRQLCREYGIQAYMTLAKIAKQQPLLDWIVVQEPAKKVEEVSDRYLVCNEHYKPIRDEVTKLKLAGDPKDLQQMLQTLPLATEQKEVLLLLALHREVTMSALHPMPPPVRTAMAENMRKFVEDCDILQDKAVAQQLCENQLGEAGSPLRVQPDQDLGVQSLVCVLTHLRLALRPGANGSHLLNPLSALVFQPANMANAFLPTMPQDNWQEVLGAIQEKVWQCPKGHRYLIGDCGRPYQEGRCPCGQRIGGTNHVPVSQNQEGAGGDQTQRGHILGPAAQRGLESVPERQLSAVECALLRFLTHAALYLGASDSAQAVAVCQMVVPRIAPGQVTQFFWKHVQRDLQVLQRVLGRSADDIFLVLHHVCHLMAWTQRAGVNPVLLQSKEERTQWERQMTATYLAPTVKILDTILRNGNRAIVSDTRQGESALLKLVYEDEVKAADLGAQNLQANPSVWRYRPRITVDQFFREFHLQVESRAGRKDDHPVLRLFKAERHIIHALHYVPAILAGQRRLMMQLHRRLDRAEAATLTIAEVMDRKVTEYTGLEHLLSNFSKAWEIVKEHLIGFQCPDPVEGVVSLPEELHNASVTRDSPIAVLLPSTRGPGLCSYILLQFLIRKNNDFLRTYCPLVKQQYNSLQEVNVRAVTERHLVGSSPERDLLPMVLTHCNYSLMVGQAATLDYDFAAFQQQLQDTLLQCKARVQRSPLGHIPVETMVYRADTTSSRLFKVLREKIDQECLSPAERRQIVEDLHDQLPDICQSIDNLNTALSFLKALGGQTSVFLHEFMSSTLKMKRTLYSRKAQQLCCLTHVQSLWILLCYQRASILAAHHQDAFDGVEKELREDLTPEQGKELEAMCQRMSIERLELLLLQLFECIMLHLSEPRNRDDDFRPENYRLRDVLQANLETPLYHTEPVEVRSGLLTAEDLTPFPESLQGRHAATTWVLCHFHLANKRHQLS